MKHPRLQLNKRAFWCGVAVLVLLRCGLTSFQQAYTWVGGAPRRGSGWGLTII